MSLRILRASPLASIQGLPRTGLRKFGVPPGGAFDTESALLASYLVGNDSLLDCLELPLSGGEFLFEEETTCAVVGATCHLELDGKQLQGNSRFPISPTCNLRVGPALDGARVYLAVKGGLRSDLAYEAGAPLKAARLAQMPRSVTSRVLRFIAGPHFGLFDARRFQMAAFQVSREADRRGIRLAGDFEGAPSELPSEPTCIGAIQVTSSGTPIILGVDGPTIGGYPKIGYLIEADLPILGQVRVGDTLAFELVQLDDARRINLLASEQLLKQATLRFA